MAFQFGWLVHPREDGFFEQHTPALEIREDPIREFSLPSFGIRRTINDCKLGFSWDSDRFPQHGRALMPPKYLCSVNCLSFA